MGPWGDNMGGDLDSEIDEISDISELVDESEEVDENGESKF